MKNKTGIFLNELGTAIGIGVMAGIVGTAAITISQMIEMKIDGREPSSAPADAASKVLDMQPANEEKKSKVSQQIHWAYGTSWGIARGLISLTGLKGWKATLVHFAAIWGTANVMLPALEVAPPATEEDAKTISVDGLHHAVYAVAAGLAFDAIAEKTSETALHREWVSAKKYFKKKLA
ncbi:hypothetical protein [Mucilaginibacter arboris]|uniref:hypothetical protein n=1 Tax=Mucilaginibacter arboris TaxID=2682090 RepID=UPI0018DDF2DF|nr:hypothetical protein [Mucilaginibacter arboris]